MHCVKMGKNLTRLKTVLTCPIRQFICRITNICRRTVRLRAVKLVYNMMVVICSISFIEGRRWLFRFVIKFVESLFTNVPVFETIDIIINNVYHSNTMSPPEISEQNMRNLLLICCTQAPFKFKENIYLQIDRVSMGSRLGPTFADFYMANLENKILGENNNFNSVFYIRYVDDTLT